MSILQALLQILPEENKAKLAQQLAILEKSGSEQEIKAFKQELAQFKQQREQAKKMRTLELIALQNKEVFEQIFEKIPKINAQIPKLSDEEIIFQENKTALVLQWEASKDKQTFLNNLEQQWKAAEDNLTKMKEKIGKEAGLNPSKVQRHEIKTIVSIRFEQIVNGKIVDSIPDQKLTEESIDPVEIITLERNLAKRLLEYFKQKHDGSSNTETPGKRKNIFKD